MTKILREGNGRDRKGCACGNEAPWSWVKTPSSCPGGWLFCKPLVHSAGYTLKHYIYIYIYIFKYICNFFIVSY